MAIIKCPECSQSVSDAANACPHCGYPIAEMQNNISAHNASSALQEETTPKNDVNTVADTQGKPKVEVFGETWFVIMMLIVFFPVGCFLAWKYKKFSVPVRIASSIACGLLFLVVLYFITIPSGTLEHEWKEATCETPKTCELCGETSGEAAGHQWKFTSCTTPKVCEVCGKESEEPADHKWKTVTCAKPKTCEVCGETSGKAAGHQWKTASCSKPKTCKICGKTSGAAAGHQWRAATCIAPQTCEICGKTSGAAAGHEWEAATCLDPKTCVYCQATEGSKLGHSFTAKVASDEFLCAEATKNSPATYYYSCTRCQTAGTKTFTQGQRVMDTWVTGNYVSNDFGEDSEQWFITTQESLDGTFENANAEGAELLAKIVYDCNDDLTIFLYEYGNEINLVKNDTDDVAYYKISVQDENGKTYEGRGLMMQNEDRITIMYKDSVKIAEMMKTSKTLRFFIAPENSQMTEYRFDVEMNNFKNLLQEMK